MDDRKARTEQGASADWETAFEGDWVGGINGTLLELYFGAIGILVVGTSKNIGGSSQLASGRACGQKVSSSSAKKMVYGVSE